MKQKTVPLPEEDPVTFGVNAAKPLLDGLSRTERDGIELLITCSESGLDFGKSISTYIHRYLELSRNCRMFEIKQACYAGTAGLQMALACIQAQSSAGARALVIATDVCRNPLLGDADAMTNTHSFAEPSSGAGAVALLVSADPTVFQVDLGASGYYGYEVMDTCRPTPDSDAGDADLSLMSYLDCHEQAFSAYLRRVPAADYQKSFQYLAFHTPFAGLVKGAHRIMMRKRVRASPSEIDTDFRRRVEPGLDYCQRVGNIMSGSVFLALASTIDNAPIEALQRIGCFSYGSGCCSEFYSGLVTPVGRAAQKRFAIRRNLDERYLMNLNQYEANFRQRGAAEFGTRNARLVKSDIRGSASAGRATLYLSEIRNFHRDYAWHG